MSPFLEAVQLVLSLNKGDFKILKIFASSLKNHQSLTLSNLSQYSKLDQNVIEHHLERLVKFELIKKNRTSYMLLVTGLDMYVLKILSNKNIIDAIGPQIGIGKEAEIFLAYDSIRKDKIVKMFRLGKSSFKQVKKKRDMNLSKNNSWLLLNIETAKKEYDILKHLIDFNVSVPIPLYRSFHCIVMEPIYSSRLSEVRNLDNPEFVLEKIIDNIHLAYRSGYINGDLNQYNILVNDDNIFIIDWPQAIRIDSIIADHVLIRDVRNILNFFVKKFQIKRDLKDTIKIIKRI